MAEGNGGRQLVVFPVNTLAGFVGFAIMTLVVIAVARQIPGLKSFV